MLYILLKQTKTDVTYILKAMCSVLEHVALHWNSSEARRARARARLKVKAQRRRRRRRAPRFCARARDAIHDASMFHVRNAIETCLIHFHCHFKCFILYLYCSHLFFSLNLIYLLFVWAAIVALVHVPKYSLALPLLRDYSYNWLTTTTVPRTLRFAPRLGTVIFLYKLILNI